MNELELLTQMRSGVPTLPPSPQAEEKLLASIAAGPARQRSYHTLPRLAGPRGPRRVRRLALAGGLTAAVTAGALAAALVPVGGRSAAPASHFRAPTRLTVLQVTDRAASAAQAQPALAPSQWVYLQITTRDPGSSRRVNQITWETANGVWGATGPHSKPFNFSPAVCKQDRGAGLGVICSITYASLHSLPESPAALLAHLEGLYPSAPASRRPALAFATINVLFNKFVMPPATLAEMYHALALIPRVTVNPHVIDMVGQRAIGITYPGTVALLGRDGELLLNPRTYLYLGDQVGRGTQFSSTLYLRVVPVHGPGVTP